MPNYSQCVFNAGAWSVFIWGCWSWWSAGNRAENFRGAGAKNRTGTGAASNSWLIDESDWKESTCHAFSINIFLFHKKRQPFAGSCYVSFCFNLLSSWGIWMKCRDKHKTSKLCFCGAFPVCWERDSNQWPSNCWTACATTWHTRQL